MDHVYRSYYTESDPLIHYMTDMLEVGSGMSILEPCAGAGAFVDALLGCELNVDLDLFELNPDAFFLLQNKYKDVDSIKVTLSDTLIDEELELKSSFGGYYDRIIANPPYGGWQEYDRRKSLKRRFPDFYVKETYSLFLVKCIKLLKESGRLVFIIPDTWLNLHMHKKLRSFLLLNTKLKEIALFPSNFFPGVSFGYADLSIITLEKCSNAEDCLGMCQGF